MKFGLFFLPASPEEGPSHDRLMQDWIEQIQYAEELSFDSVWLSEHHFSRSRVSPGGYGMPSSAVQAAYVAARTSRIRTGISVVVLPWHNPLHLVEDFALVDIFSGGRFDPGIGRGNQAYEFGALGVLFHDTQERFDECLEVILKAWQVIPAFNREEESRPIPPLEFGAARSVGAESSEITRASDAAYRAQILVHLNRA